jgi:hypothetical protein
MNLGMLSDRNFATIALHFGLFILKDEKRFSFSFQIFY